MKKLLLGVGSTNPVKIAAAKQGLEFVLQKRGEKLEIIAQGFAVESGVSAQPFSEEETRTGAVNRAKAVLKSDPKIELAIGLEGGVSEQSEGLHSTVWVALIDRKGNEQLVNGLRFLLPENLVNGLKQGKEMGDVMDEISSTHNTKHGLGMVGIFTDGVIDRTEGYETLVRLAGGLFWHFFQ